MVFKNTVVSETNISNGVEKHRLTAVIETIISRQNGGVE